MRAVIQTKYGLPDVLQLMDIEKPVPGNIEVLVKIHASSLNQGNLVLLKGKPFAARFAFGLSKPKYAVPGGDFAGRIEAIGKDVTQFKTGDEVFGDLSSSGWGAFSEYAAVPEHALALKPANLSYEEAAALPMAGVTALQALRDKGNIKLGQKVLIYGASGGVGTFFIQLAKHYGAEVTAVCSQKHKHSIEQHGADYIIDYQGADFSLAPRHYDVIIGVNGFQPLSIYKQALKSGGVFVHVGGSGAQLSRVLLFGPLISKMSSKRFSSFLHRPKQEDLVLLKEIAEEGGIKPVIVRNFMLEDIQEAFHYFNKGHIGGKVIIQISALDENDLHERTP
ncbi:NADPH:quinone reductase [Terribacillus aidingensis]|uniref:NADPH:quinone reductase n=1 Tax=Terribacillus aidingensis TaxID=586416 RepID=A0A285NMC2_9BACI|nr:NAD(P)-dependent alcohol dehydrogenase [Terribacillus aidingensis]SNZ10619.1 NADPH:quinone reductase [Terribacillus aidingensis]